MSKSPPAAKGITAQLQDLKRRVDVLAAQIVRPEAAQSAYDRTAKGVVARQVLTAPTSTISTDVDSDMTLLNVAVVAGRIYAVHLHTTLAWASLDAAAHWALRLRIDGVDTAVLADVKLGDVNSGARVPVDGTVYWTPAATGAASDLLVRLDLVAGSCDISLQATGTNPRTLTLIDLGLAP